MKNAILGFDDTFKADNILFIVSMEMGMFVWIVKNSIATEVIFKIYKNPNKASYKILYRAPGFRHRN